MNKKDLVKYYKKKIGETIAKYRKLKGLSQKELAASADITPQTLSCIESGINNPSFKVMIKFADTLNIPLAYFFTFDDEIYNIEDKELIFLASEAFSGLDYEKRKIAFKLIECFKKEQE